MDPLDSMDQKQIDLAMQQRELPDEEARVVADLSWGKGHDEFTRDHAEHWKIIPLNDGVVLRFMDPPRLDPDPAQYRPHSLCIEIILGPRAAAQFVVDMGNSLRKAYSGTRPK